MRSLNYKTLLDVDLSGSISEFTSQIPIEQQKALLITFVLSMVAYGFYAFGPVLGREELFYIWQRGETMNKSYAQAARPLAWYITHKALAGSFIPFFGICLSSLLLSLSGVILAARILGLQSTIEISLIASLFATSPLMAQAQTFLLWNVFFSTAVFLPILAASFTTGNSWKFVPLSALLITATLMIYQTYLSFFATAILLFLLAKTLVDEVGIDSLVQQGKIACRGLVAMVIGMLLYLPIYLAMTKETSDYTAFQNEKIDSLHGLLLNVKKILTTEFSFIYSFDSFLYRRHFVVFFIVISIVFLMGFLTRRGTIKDAFMRFSLVIFFLLLLVPALRLDGLLIVNMTSQPRLWSTIAAFMAGICGLSLLHRPLLLKTIAFLCGALLLYSFLIHHNVQSFFLWTEHKHDISVANRVAQRIENDSRYDPNKKYYLYVIGSKKTLANRPALYHPPLKSSAIKENSDSFSFMLNLIGVMNVNYDWSKRLDRKFQQKMRREAAAMKPWPAEDAVKFTDDNRIIVKF